MSLFSSSEEIKNVAALADENGEVSKEEFVEYANNSEFFHKRLDRNNPNSIAAKEAKATSAFKAFDKDNDGFITKEEFARISKKLNKDQVDAVFKKFDRDQDGVLSLQEFQKMFKK